MGIKWHKNILYYRKIKLKFRDNIICADIFREWLVVALPYKLFFLGDDEIVLPFAILSVHITKTCIFYHDNYNKNVYKLIHPYDEVEYLFHSPLYTLKFTVMNKIYVLEKDKICIVRYNNKIYNLYCQLLDPKHCFKLFECSNLEETHQRLLNIKTNDINVFLYQNYVLLTCKNFLSFMYLKNSLLVIDDPIVMNEDTKICRIRKFNVKVKYINFLQINNLLFIKNKLILCFKKYMYLKAFKATKYCRNFFPIFWIAPDKLEKKLLAALDEDEWIPIVTKCIHKKEYVFGQNSLNPEKMECMLESELIHYKSITNFADDTKQYAFVQNSNIINAINVCLSRDIVHIETPNLSNILSIQYQRIFRYNPHLVYDKKVMNIAHALIYIEKCRNISMLREKKIDLFLFCKSLHKDDRMVEVIKLFNEPIKIFELDENNIEDGKEKNYILRKSAFIGKAFCFYDITYKIKYQKIDYGMANLEFTLPLIRDGIVSNIEIKDKDWKMWPSFNAGCYKILSSNKSIGFKQIIEMSIDDDSMLAGIIYGLGIKKHFKDMYFKGLIDSINVKNSFVVMSLIISFGMSNKNCRNIEYEEFCFEKIMSDQCIEHRLAAFYGLSYIFASTKNFKLQNLLFTEINRSGTYKSHCYNKNNVIYYDKYYKLICTLNLVRVVHEIKDFTAFTCKLSELMFNGLCLLNKAKCKRKFLRSKDDPLDEIFYSNFFLEEDTEVTNANKVLALKVENLNINKDAVMIKKLELHLVEIEKKYENFSAWEIYKYAGKIFFYATLKNIMLKPWYINILDKIEKKMEKNKLLRVLFDYMLITFCVSNASSCDLDLLKFLRRQIKRSEMPREVESSNLYMFTNSGIKKDISYGTLYGNIEMYNICLGILNLGLLRYEFYSSKCFKLALISTFYLNWPQSPYDQEYFTYMRYELFHSITKKDEIDLNKYICTQFFKKKYNKLNAKDKKYVIDVLSDYYENYNISTDYMIDIEFIKDLIIRSE